MFSCNLLVLEKAFIKISLISRDLDWKSSAVYIFAPVTTFWDMWGGHFFLHIIKFCNCSKRGEGFFLVDPWSLYRDHFVYAPNHWEMTLQCNVISQWLGAYTKWFLPVSSWSSLIKVGPWLLLPKQNPVMSFVDNRRLLALIQRYNVQMNQDIFRLCLCYWLKIKGISNRNFYVNIHW